MLCPVVIVRNTNKIRNCLVFIYISPFNVNNFRSNVALDVSMHAYHVTNSFDC